MTKKIFSPFGFENDKPLESMCPYCKNEDTEHNVKRYYCFACNAEWSHNLTKK